MLTLLPATAALSVSRTNGKPASGCLMRAKHRCGKCASVGALRPLTDRLPCGVYCAAFSQTAAARDEFNLSRLLLSLQLVKLDAAQGNAQAQALYADALRRTGAVGQAVRLAAQSASRELGCAVSILRTYHCQSGAGAAAELISERPRAHSA